MRRIAKKLLFCCSCYIKIKLYRGYRKPVNRVGVTPLKIMLMDNLGALIEQLIRALLNLLQELLWNL